MIELGLLVTSKNESMILCEWLEHYEWQGVRRVYFIDNGSTDETVAILKPYIERGFVDYYFLPERYGQVAHYNWVFDRVAVKVKIGRGDAACAKPITCAIQNKFKERQDTVLKDLVQKIKRSE